MTTSRKKPGNSSAGVLAAQYAAKFPVTVATDTAVVVPDDTPAKINQGRPNERLRGDHEPAQALIEPGQVQTGISPAGRWRKIMGSGRPSRREGNDKRRQRKNARSF